MHHTLNLALAAIALGGLALTPTLTGAQPAEPPGFTPTVGGWRTRTLVSPFDGKAEYGALLDATSGVSNSIGRFETPTLVVRCTSNRGLEAHVSWGTFMSLGEAETSLRFDDQPVQSVTWSSSSDGEATGPKDARANRVFVDTLATAHRLAIRAPRHSSTPAEVAFDLTGADQIVAEAKKACP